MTNDTQRIAQSDLVERIAHAAIVIEHGPEKYADQARAGNWPIWRVARTAAQSALSLPQPTLDREAIARKLCEQHGGDPDAIAAEEHDCWEGPLWTAFTDDAHAILALTTPPIDDITGLVPGGRAIVPAALVDALRKVMPIRVNDGPDYAEAYFADGSTHSTQAMTMNPQDWRDVNAAWSAMLSSSPDYKGGDAK